MQNIIDSSDSIKKVSPCTIIPCEHEQIKEFKKQTQDQQDMITELKDLSQELKQEIDQLKVKLFELKNDSLDIKKNYKSTTIISFTQLLGAEDEIHEYLMSGTWYCSDEYIKYYEDYPNVYKNIQYYEMYPEEKDDIEKIVNNFFDTGSKKLIFNMHYTNRIKKLKFVSIYLHTINYLEGSDITVASAIDHNGLGFIVTPSNEIYTYRPCNTTGYSEYPDIFDQMFTFDIHTKTNVYECDQILEKIADSILSYNPYNDAVLTIIQSKI